MTDPEDPTRPEAPVEPDDVEDLDLTDEEMVARLDEAIERLSRGDIPAVPEPGEFEEPDSLEVDGDEVDSDREDITLLPEQRDDEEAAAKRWAPVEDVATSDIALQATEEPLTESELWAPAAEAPTDDLRIIELEPEQREDPWGPIRLGDAPGAPLALPSPPAPQLPSHLPDLLIGPTGDPKVTESAPGRFAAIPWRGSVAVRAPELPDQLYVADVARAHSSLLVAAWSTVEDAPGAAVVRLRLADDGPEIDVEATGPHEPAIECDFELGGHRIRARLALVIDQEERGLRLGRDVLAGRFVVDPANSEWPSEEDAP